jgi:Probable cobalt transporter subunit (CbtB)
MDSWVQVYLIENLLRYTGHVQEKEFRMASHNTGSIPQPVFVPSIPVSEVLPWALFGGLLLLLAIYFVGAEQGATSMMHGRSIHEFVHDGRHLLGFPCH